jgi:CubicO group peptidase (beta-lactamase class C family)
MSRIAYQSSLLALWPALLVTSCATSSPLTPPAPGPASSRPATYWQVRGEGVSTARLSQIRQALRICAKGLEGYVKTRPRPLEVIAYADRLAFVRGLQHELGYPRKVAMYFLHSSSPRPVKDKLLVPPNQAARNICHELVHHVMESTIPRKRLLQAKWFDEGSASLLSAKIIEPKKIREQLGWFRSRHSYVPFYHMRTEEGWGELHRVRQLRSLAYLQAMDLINHLLRHHGTVAFKGIVERSRNRPVDDAFEQVTGLSVETFFAQWLQRTRGSFGANRLLDPVSAARPWLPPAKPADVGLDSTAVRRLVREAARTRSDSLLVIKDGKVVVERYFLDEHRPIKTMSVTKSIVSLAIGRLLAQGKIASLDTQMCTWLPEWKRDGRAKVTLRHILTHTSGLAHARAAGKMNRHADRTRYARQRPLVTPPGLRFSYNNEAAQLLSEVVKQAAGMPLDRYMERELFRPLGILDYRWERDPAGNVQSFYGLALSGRDLARLGLLMLNGGRHEDQQLLPPKWIQQSTAPGLPAFPQMGLLWWRRHRGAVWVQPEKRLARLEHGGLRLARKLRPLCGKRFSRREAYWLQLGSRLSRRERGELLRWIESKDSPLVKVPDSFIGFNANGWQGQYLAVYPMWNLVVVRQRRPITYTEEENKHHGMWSLFKLAEKLVPATSSGLSDTSQSTK